MGTDLMLATFVGRRMGENLTYLPNDGEVEFAARIAEQKQTRTHARNAAFGAFVARLVGKRPATGIMRPI